MIVAGVMSGTSADGINVALVRIHPRNGRGRGRHSNLQLLGHAEFAYPAAVRRFVLAAMNSERASVADLARLNFLLAELYAEAVLWAQKKLRAKADLVGCHGQTIYHQATPLPFLARRLAVTWQTGEGSRIAARTGIPVVSDFRPADMAVGGKGAPLVPYLDYFLYGHSNLGRIALNIGGIANVTAIAAAASLDDVLAFDTGPGNMVVDALTEQLFGKPYDRAGNIAAAGSVIDELVARFLRERFFRHKPPKTAGREEFGREFAQKFRKACRRAKAKDADVIATATAFTVRSIAHALRRFVLRRGDFSELIVSGGGTKNSTLVAWLAKEAMAFAVLAYETWNRRPSNVPSATGAKRAVVLGKVSYP
jgi:anhydro-N-acetylmuramic acid kinase